MLKKCVVFLVLAMSLVVFNYVEITYADGELPSWAATENFVPPKDAKKAKKFSGTLSFSTTQMTVTPTPEEAAPAAENFPALEPANKDQLIRLGNIEMFAVHLGIGDFNVISDPFHDGMPRIDNP